MLVTSPTPRRVGVAVLVTVTALFGVVLFAAANARAIGIGESGFYSFGGSDCNENNHIDPVGVLFVGKGAWPRNVGDQTGRFAGWQETVWGGDQWLQVHQGGSNYACKMNDYQVASHGNVIPSSRYHVRLWFIDASQAPEKKTVGTPHHEDLKTCGHAVDANGPEGSGFDQARRALVEGFVYVGHRPYEPEDWGNTQNRPQCDGDMAASNGWGAIIGVGTQMNPYTNLATFSKATSSTLNGRLRTDEAKTEYWFGYGPNSSQGESGYPYKTAVKSVSGSAEFDTSEVVSGLTPSTNYYVRLFARNQDGEVDEGNETKYTTCDPIVNEDDNAPGPHAVASCTGAVDVFYRTPNGELGHSWTQGGTWSQGPLPGSLAPYSVPHPVVQSNGAVDVFWKTPSNGLGHAWDDAGGWHVETLPGSLASEPHPAAQPNGTIDVLYQTPGGGLGHDWYQPGGQWLSNTLTGSVASDPYPVANANGAVDVFYRTPSGSLGHSWTQGGTWSQETLPGSVHEAATPHPVTQSNGTVDVFWKTPSNGLGHAWDDAGGWHVDTLSGSLAGEPRPAVQPNGVIDVFFRNASNQLGHDWYVPGNAWSSGIIPGSPSTDPDAVAQPNGTVDVFFRNASGELGHDWFVSGLGWNANVLSGTMDPASSPHAVAQANGTIDVFHRTPSGELGHNWYQAGDQWLYNTLPGSVALDPPKATTQTAGAIGVNQATLNGTVNPEGAATSYYFEYGLTTAYGSKKPTSAESIGSGVSDVAVSQALTGLAEGTTYHYRVVAASPVGTTNGADMTLKTSKSPLAATEAATEVKPASATLKGLIKPRGLPTTYRFEYGSTTGYGTSIPVPEGNAGSGETAVVSQIVSELTPEKTYHYRVVAKNAAETSFGNDMTFRTSVPTHQLQFSFGSAGSGNGQFSYPWGLDVDGQGNLWAVDWGNNRVQKFNSKGEYLSQFGSLGSGNGQFNEPLDVAVTSEGDLWVTDGVNGRVQKFSPNGVYLGKLGSSGSGPGQFVEPWGIDIAPNGHIWVADARFYRVEEFLANGDFVREVHGIGYGGSAPGEFAAPRGLEVDANGHVWVTDVGNNRVTELAPTGQYLSQFGSAGSGDGQFNEPQAIAVKPSGDLLVADRYNGRVQQFTSSGQYLAKFGSGLSEVGGLAVGPAGTVYVSNSPASKVQKWRQLVPSATTQPATSVQAEAASLAATVNPGGATTTYRFEYGKTTGYGTKVPVPNESIGSGTTDVAVSKAITGLEAGTTYHFRVLATNANGTALGQDATFTTETPEAAKLAGMAVTDPFDKTTSAVSNFNSEWSKLGWAGSLTPKGEVRSNGWGPADGHPNVNGAYYPRVLTDTGPGIAAGATVTQNPGFFEGRYFSVWLDMSSPASASRAGYELKFTHVSADTYNVALSKWVGGTQTSLASKTNYSLPLGSSFALVDQGANVSAWVKTGSSFSQLLSASDSAFASGYTGVEGAGNVTRLTKFKTGSLLTPVASMDAGLKSLALNDSFERSEVPLSLGGAWGTLGWAATEPTNNTGRVTSTGWGPYHNFPVYDGAHWTKATVPDTGAGVGVAATLTAKPAVLLGSFSLWLGIPNPASASKSGYVLRFAETSSASVYDVVVTKWLSGVKTNLASTTISFPVGSQLALVDKGGTVSAWTKTGSEYTQLFSAVDTAFNSGYVGIEGSGPNTRLKELRSGPLPPF